MVTGEERVRSVDIAAPQLDERESARVSEVVESGRLAAGETVTEFETAFADFCETDHAVATSNGTTALHTALHALGIGEGDRVVTTPFSFVASANAVRFCGAEPVFADIDPETYNLDPHAVESVVREHDVDAILAVHLYGLPADMDHLADIAETHDLALIEDAAQAHGARHDGRPVGAIGDAGTFSFYPTKNMTTGEGGAVVTDRDDVAERAERFVNHGRDGSYRHVDLGHNFRMTNLAAAIGLVQLEKLPQFNRARRANAAELTDMLEDTSVIPPVEPVERRHVYHQYTIRTQRRERLQDALSAAGVDTGVYYPTPIHEQPAYEGVDASAPVASRAAEEVLSLPIHPETTEADRRTIARTIREVSHE
ncbi:aminotransferase DegT (plasmid) [Halorientalis sp. IM1011]|uniref:DegT/DnrJ/EryC1/StrS family aminotransferase n=1 Tax=Halorientalis sp. IM1011 TaxID=1932360 RepID=UPI00097CD50D|nr:DegT/DnrJ/EryC1/StrS family aminotransferase [Halorientalis sp. IM1011]AQL44918.1 aminotransferase DegT [Halorientalis sp. IM1011]